MIEVPTMPYYIRWITKLSFFTYGYTVLMINEFHGLTVYFDPDGYSPTIVPGDVILAVCDHTAQMCAFCFAFKKIVLSREPHFRGCSDEPRALAGRSTVKVECSDSMLPWRSLTP